MEQMGASFNRRDFLVVLFKHRWKILTVFATMVIIVTVSALTLPTIYQATSTVLVKFGRENIYRSEVGDRGSWVSLSHEDMVNSEIQILTSRDLIERVIETMGPELLYPGLSKGAGDLGGSGESAAAALAVPIFKGSLSVEGVKKSNVILISFQHEDPRIAARAANLMVDLYKEKHLQVHSDPKSSFLEEQLRTYERALRESEDRLEGYRQRYQTFSLPDQKSLLLQQRTNFDTTLKNTRNQVAELQQKLNVLRNQMQEVPRNVPLSTVTDRHEIVDNVKNTLLNLQLKERDLLTKYLEDNPIVLSVRTEITLVKDFLRKQEIDLKRVRTTGRNVVYQELEKETIKAAAEMAAQEAKGSALQMQVGHLDHELNTLALREKELDRLLREREVNEKNFKTYLERSEKARILEDMNLRKMANVSVVQKAVAPLHPIRPRRGLYAAFSLVLGAIGGLGFAFFCEYLSQGFSTPEQVEKRLGLRVLLSLPYRPVSYLPAEENRDLHHRTGVAGC